MYNIMVKCENGENLIYDVKMTLNEIKKQINTYKRIDKKYNIKNEYIIIKL